MVLKLPSTIFELISLLEVKFKILAIMKTMLSRLKLKQIQKCLNAVGKKRNEFKRRWSSLQKNCNSF